jgi:hypothetical protein
VRRSGNGRIAEDAEEAKMTADNGDRRLAAMAAAPTFVGNRW